MAKVLYIDDEPDNIDLLSRRLTRRGFEVMGAMNAAEGIALAAQWKPDLILMDIRMPGLDGYEATTRLKADPATRSIPVIVLTADAARADEERARAVGADDYATKPVELPTLLDKIQKLLPPA